MPAVCEGVSVVERQQNLKLGVAGPAFHFDQAVVLLHERLRERQTETAAVLAPRYERIEDAVTNVLGNAGAVVDDMQVQCQLTLAFRHRDLACNARAQFDARVALRDAFAQCLCRIAHDVQKRLDQLLLVAAQVRHADVVIALDREAARKLRENHLTHALAHFVNIHVADDSADAGAARASGRPAFAAGPIP